MSTASDHEAAILRGQLRVSGQIMDFARAFLAEHDTFIAIPLPAPDPALHFAQAARLKEAADALREAFAALDAAPSAMVEPCPIRSAITDQPCLLAYGHDQHSPERFHKFEQP